MSVDATLIRWAREHCPPSPRVRKLQEEGKEREAELEYSIELTAKQLGMTVRQYKRIYAEPVDEARLEAGVQVVYFMAHSASPRDGGPVKIGVAVDVERRRVHLQSSSPYEIHVLGTTPGGRELEIALHGQFVADRIRGEWYRMSPALRARIRGCDK